MGYKDKSVKGSKTPYINSSASEYCPSLPAIKPLFCAGKHHPLPYVKLVIVVVVTRSIQLALVLPMSRQSAKLQKWDSGYWRHFTIICCHLSITHGGEFA